jgi:hypothetical protein
VGKAVEIRLKLLAPFPCDLLVSSPRRIRQRLAWGDFFIGEVLGKEEVLYETHHR